MGEDIDLLPRSEELPFVSSQADSLKQRLVRIVTGVMKQAGTHWVFKL